MSVEKYKNFNQYIIERAGNTFNLLSVAQFVIYSFAGENKKIMTSRKDK